MNECKSVNDCVGSKKEREIPYELARLHKSLENIHELQQRLAAAVKPVARILPTVSECAEKENEPFTDFGANLRLKLMLSQSIENGLNSILSSLEL